MIPPAGAAIPAPKGYPVQGPITCKGRLHHFSWFICAWRQLIEVFGEALRALVFMNVIFEK
jgi:hypothetical protein